MTTTVETVTASQIRRLREEAFEANDMIQVDLCGLALGCFSDQPFEDGEEADCRSALAECVRVIAEAEAAR